MFGRMSRCGCVCGFDERGRGLLHLFLVPVYLSTGELRSFETSGLMALMIIYVLDDIIHYDLRISL